MIARMSCGKLSVGGSRVQNTKRLVTVTEFDENGVDAFSAPRDVLHVRKDSVNLRNVS